MMITFFVLSAIFYVPLVSLPYKGLEMLISFCIFKALYSIIFELFYSIIWKK
jgi:hypothetical protein